MKYIETLRLFNRNTRLCLGMWALVGFGYLGVFTVAFNLYMLRLGLGPESIGLVNSSGFLAVAFFSLPSAWLGRRFGIRRTMILGVGASGTGFALIPLAELLPVSLRTGWIGATYLIVGFCGALFMVNGVPFLMASTTPRERHHAFSVQAAIMLLFGFAGNLAAGFLPGLFSKLLLVPLDQPAPYRYPLLIVPAAYLTAFFLIAATRKVKPVEPQKKRAATPGTAPLVLIAFMASVSLLRMSGIWIARIFFNVYMDAGLQAPTALIGAIAACGQLLGATAALIMPVLARRWGRFGAILSSTLAVFFCLLVMAFFPNWLAAGLSSIALR